MSINVACKESITAINTTNLLFVKGRYYSGEISGESLMVKDEFGAFQRLSSNDKFFKKHFMIMRAGTADEEK